MYAVQWNFIFVVLILLSAGYGVFELCRYLKQRNGEGLFNRFLRFSLLAWLITALSITLLPPWGWGFGGLHGAVGYNLVPFRDMARIVSFWDFWSAGALWMLGGNILLFVPLGFLLPLTCPDKFTFWKTVLAGFFLSFFIESLQLTVFVYRSANVDDLILNTLGAALGYCLARGLLYLLKLTKQKASTGTT